MSGDSLLPLLPRLSDSPHNSSCENLREGDEVEKINNTWLWMELGGVAGYVPVPMQPVS